MLDDLFGRTELKECVDRLRTERDELVDRVESLERQLAAEQDRRADAVSDRQDAQERANRLEDRIAGLEGRLDDGDEEAAAVAPRYRETVRGRRLDAVLDRLESLSAGPEAVLTATVDDATDLPDGATAVLGDRVPLVRRLAPCLLVADDAGLVAVALSSPVRPEPFAEWGSSPSLDRDWFRPAGPHAVALVRSDLFAYGAYEGDERVDFAAFDAEIPENHSKGGFSQGRYERQRDDAIADHVERVETALADRDRSPLYVLGERTILSRLAVDARARAPVDASGDPEAALDDAVHSFWTTEIVCL
ncbi:hypothetical protein BRD17_08955 [Halobacteriales archaeon SW_7_68_16]|nr:MAG: hypothetical protein BRD17_08955 [Halobacteriales archaeon SW_7_68_16]